MEKKRKFLVILVASLGKRIFLNSLKSKAKPLMTMLLTNI